MAELAYDDVPDRLAKAVPEFGDLILEHRADFGEVLNHVLFGDLTRFTLTAWRDGNDELVKRILTFLDWALRSSDDRVQNLVAVSFVENIGPWDPAMVEFIATWPASLRAEAQAQGYSN